MGKLAQYQQFIQDVLRQYADHPTANEHIEVQLSCDTEHNHYHVFNVGWVNTRRVYGCVLHLDIKNEKIWIQHDGTEEGIANEFLKLGVPKSDIVLGFHSPYKRQFTEFAVN